MMKKLIAALFLCLVSCACIRADDGFYAIDQDGTGFGGGIDYVSADKQAQKYSRIDGILNVNTDRYNEITKKYGSLKYNTTATGGAKKHRRAYTYNQADGDSYIIVQTSTSLTASVGDGSFSTFITTLTETSDCDFTTARDILYFTDGANTPGSWDGATLTNYTVENSTNYPAYCKYMTNWHSRNWMTGDTRYKTRVYYSQPYVVGLDTCAYENYPIENYIDLGTSDGDIITGIQVVNGYLYVYFKYKIFQIYEASTGIFAYTMLSTNIGCLYNTTLDILNGFPIFMSHRGIEQFDGSQFTLRSLPIDNYVKSLKQLDFSQSALSLDTAADWGAGSGVNIDTTTYAGSVAIANRTVSIIKTSAADWNGSTCVDVDTTTTAGSVTLVAYSSAAPNIAIGKTVTESRHAYSYVGSNAFDGNDSSSWSGLTGGDDSNKTAAAGEDVFVKVDLGSAMDIVRLRCYMLFFCFPGTAYFEGSTNDSTWTTIYSISGSSYTHVVDGLSGSEYFIYDFNSTSSVQYRYLRFRYHFSSAFTYPAGFHCSVHEIEAYTRGVVAMYPLSSGSVTSSFDFGYTPSSFGDVGSDFTLGSGSSVTFYTRSSSDNETWEGWVFASTGTTIPSTVNRYLQVASTLTASTDGLSTPTLNSITVNCVDLGSYTSKVNNATSWGSWGAFSASDNQGGNEEINYYVRTSTASDNLSTKAYIPVNNGSAINSTVGPYIDVISSFTRSSTSSIPKIDSVRIDYYGSDNNIPYGKVFNDAYYLAVNTTTADSRNDCMLVLQKNGDWTRYDNNAACLAVYRNKLYYGDSRDTGFMYRMEVPNLYTDNGAAYSSYWTSKKININPLYKVMMKELWITTDGTAGDINALWNFNDYDGDWYSKDFTVTATNKTNTYKLNILPAGYSRYFQFRVGNSTANDFRIKRLDIIYDNVPAVE